VIVFFVQYCCSDIPSIERGQTRKCGSNESKEVQRKQPKNTPNQIHTVIGGSLESCPGYSKHMYLQYVNPIHLDRTYGRYIGRPIICRDGNTKVEKTTNENARPPQKKNKRRVCNDHCQTEPSPTSVKKSGTRKNLLTEPLGRHHYKEYIIVPLPIPIVVLFVFSTHQSSESLSVSVIFWFSLRLILSRPRRLTKPNLDSFFVIRKQSRPIDFRISFSFLDQHSTFIQHSS